MLTTVAANKIIFHLLIMCVAVSLSTCRPQNTIDSQDFSDYQTPNDDDLRLYPSYPVQTQSQARLQYLLENAPLQRIQALIGRIKPSSGSWNALYRVPETKRQVRYRQCYFNPISCFKK